MSDFDINDLKLSDDFNFSDDDLIEILYCLNYRKKALQLSIDEFEADHCNEILAEGGREKMLQLDKMIDKFSAIVKHLQNEHCEELDLF